MLGAPMYDSDHTTVGAGATPSDPLVASTDRLLAMVYARRTALGLVVLLDDVMPARKPGELHSTDRRWQPPTQPYVYPLPGGEEMAAELASEWAWRRVTGRMDRQVARLLAMIRRPRGR
jgi:hypothetical protein